MTREEAKEVFLNRGFIKVNGGVVYDANKWREACSVISEWLEQEPVLDKIRAEIEQLPTKTRTNWDGCCPDIDYPEIEYVDVTKNKLLEIIDKYKAEIEPQESEE